MRKLRSDASKVSLRYWVDRQVSISSSKPPLPPWEGGDIEKSSMSVSPFPTSMELPLQCPSILVRGVIHLMGRESSSSNKSTNST